MTTGQPGLQGNIPVEILHIDTAGSREFFARCEADNAEKSLCQGLIKDLFVLCVTEAGGELGVWAGDGGCAFFRIDSGSGNCIAAAEAFLARLPQLAHQTHTTLGRRISLQDARRAFRIKAHLGIVHFGDGGAATAAGRSDQFDDFLKFERKWAITTNEFYVTGHLYKELNGSQRALFDHVRGEEQHGSLNSALYHLHRRAELHDTEKRFLKEGFDHREMTAAEWEYILKQLLSYRVNVAARNSITKGLIESAAQHTPLSRDTFVGLTLEALHQYLKIERDPADFELALWRPVGTPANSLKISAVYPRVSTLPNREVPLDDLRYKAARAFKTLTPVVVPSVDAARMKGEWVEFDVANGRPRSLMQSTMQIPIYRKVYLGEDVFEKQPRAVLSINSDRPNLFMQHEAQNWVEDLVGFLANLALGEHL